MVDDVVSQPKRFLYQSPQQKGYVVHEYIHVATDESLFVRIWKISQKRWFEFIFYLLKLQIDLSMIVLYHELKLEAVKEEI